MPFPLKPLQALFALPRPTGRGGLARWLGWYVLANSALLLLIALRYFTVLDLPAGGGARAFLGLMSVGHFVSLSFLLSLPLLLLALLAPVARLVVVLAIVSYTTLALLLLVDTFVFAQYRFHINGAVINLLTGGAAGDIFVFSWVMYLLAGLAVLALILLQLFVARRTAEALPRLSRGGLVGLALFAVFLGENFWYAWADANSYTAVTRQARFYPAYNPTQAKDSFIEWGMATEESAASYKLESRHSALNYPLAPLECGGESRLNILWIVIDSMRADVLDPASTPNMAAFAEGGLRFDNHLSGSNATRQGLFSLFYGLPATYWDAMLAEERRPVFVDELLRRDYRIATYANAKLTSPEFNRTIFADVPDLRLRSKAHSVAARDIEITDEFLQFLGQKSDRPYFGFLFYDAPHGYAFPADYELPFTPSLKEINYLALNKESDPTPFFNRYRNAVHFADSQVQRVLSALEAGGHLEDTLVLITADHGQEFNDSGQNYWGHFSNFSRYQLQVPMVLHWPGRAGERYSRLTSHYDVVPTLLSELFGCSNAPGDYSVGRSLFSSEEADHLVLGGYGPFAVMDAQQTTVVSQSGLIDIYDTDYQPLPEASVNSARMLRAMDEMSRFYAK